MIILDTNVISEPFRAKADPAVAAWLDGQDEAALFITTITLAEIMLGLELLPIGRRRAALEARIFAELAGFDDGRILNFDPAAARAYAAVMARARAGGFAIAPLDGQIAAIAHARGFSVVTRDTAPFVAAGVAVINPWVPSEGG